MNKKTRLILLVVIGTLLFICTIISFSYGYYVISSNESYELITSTNIPTCAGLTISDNKLLSLKGDYAVPLKDEQVLNSSQDALNNLKYSFTVTNNCEQPLTLSLGLSPSTDSTISVQNLKYVLVAEGQSLPSSALKFNEDSKKMLDNDLINLIKNSSNIDAQYAYNISEITVDAKTNKEYALYLWLEDDGTVNNVTNNSFFKASVIITDFDLLENPQ